MKKIKSLITAVLLLITTLSLNNTIPELSFGVVITSKEYNFNKTNLENVAPEYILAAIAYHECFNISKLERRYVMEAVWNRVQDNFNNNGTDIVKQVLAPKQFSGLFLFYPQQFKSDPNNPLCLENLSMAIDIVQNNTRVCPKRIYYWASKSTDSNTAHWRNIINKCINIKTFKQIFA